MTRGALDGAGLEAWDLTSGTELHAEAGGLIAENAYGPFVTQTWGVTTDPAVFTEPCTSGDHVAFLATGTAAGADLSPSGLWDQDNTVQPQAWGQLAGPTEWFVSFDAAGADELWVWMVYPLRDEVYGPFEASAYGGSWQWDYDTVVSGLVNEDAVPMAIACAGGSPIGANAMWALR